MSTSRFGRLVSTTAKPILTIGGIDVSDQLISFDVQDASANKNGFAFTAGTILLGDLGLTGHDVEDYDKDDFPRGTLVILDLEMHDPRTGSVGTFRHPRGYLYVTGTSYNVEASALEVSVACKLALSSLVDDYEGVKHLAELELDPAQESVANVSNSIAAAGKVAYQDNQGNIVKVRFFDGDGGGSTTDPALFTSVAGYTALSVSPLTGADALPDKVVLGYEVAEAEGDDETDNLEAPTITESSYFVEYPAVLYERVPLYDEDELPIPEDLVEPPPIPIPSPDDGCGNAPPPPTRPGQGPSDGGDDGDDIPQPTCSDVYMVVQSTTLDWVTRTETSFSRYDGPGRQISYSKSEVRGPALEVAREYFADSMAYCRSLYANRCSPNGYCSKDGLDVMLQSYTETFYEYNDSGTLVRQVTDTYESLLSAAQPFDWRSGIVNGVPQAFRKLSTRGMYLSSKRILQYAQEGNLNIETETFYQSGAATNSSGLSNTYNA